MFASEIRTHPRARKSTIGWLPISVLAVAIAVAFGVGIGRGLVSSSSSGVQSAAEQGKTSAERTVVIAGKLSDEELLALSADVLANGNGSLLLLDSPTADPYTKAFLGTYRPDRILAVGAFSAGVADLEHRLGASVARPLTAPSELFAHAERVVVCPAEPRALLLQAACLAGVLRAPLWISHGDSEEAGPLLEPAHHPSPPYDLPELQ